MHFVTVQTPSGAFCYCADTQYCILLLCRHPVPDYYNLHLEVIKNRTAAAQVVRCDSQDPSLPRCPESYKDGDRFLKWDINKKCDKYAVRIVWPLLGCSERSFKPKFLF